jgi:hypothetical protein
MATMSGLSVQSDNAVFQQAAEGTMPTPEQQGFKQGDGSTLIQEQPNGEQPQAPAQAGNEASQDGGEALQGVEDAVKVQQDEGLLGAIDALEVPEGQEENPPTEEAAKPEPVDEEGFKQFSGQFEKYTGVPLDKALETYSTQAEQIAQASQQLQATHTQLALMQQKLDVQQAWVSDPDIQQQVQQGTPLSAAVDSRLDTLRGLYKNLDAMRQQRIDRLGSKGIIELWKIYTKGKPSLPGSVGAAQTAPAGQDLMKLSAIMAMPEAEYRKTGLKLLAENQFINDLG